MDLKLTCPCGQAYEFSVEPLDGKMPAAVQCPTCGQDGTELANAEIAQQLAAPPSAPDIGAQPARAAIRVQGSAARPPQQPASLASTERPASAMPRGVTASGFPIKGIAGAVVGGTIGMLGWYLLIRLTGYEIGYAAWGVGFLTGLAGRTLAQQSSQVLGIIAGTCAFLAILGGNYLVVRAQVDEYAEKLGSQAYQSRMTFARQATKEQSDDDLRIVLAQANAEDGKAANPAVVSDDDLSKFRQNEIPKLTAFLKGQPSETQFKANLRSYLSSSGVLFRIFEKSLGPLTLLWLFLGVGSAYKICARS